MLGATTEQTSLFICSQETRPARQFLEDIKAVASSSQYNALVVVGRAIFDFSDKGTAVELVQGYYCCVADPLQGVRFGWNSLRILYQALLIRLMNNVKAPCLSTF
jgi:hypothetical protein